MSFTSPLLSDTFPKRASAIASYYGFTPTTDLFTRNKSLKRVRVAFEPHMKRDPFSSELYELLKDCADRELHKSGVPVLLYHFNRDTRDAFHEHPRRTLRFSLLALGIDKSIAEAVVLHAASAILRDLSVPSYCVYVNSIGDRDSAAKFARETTAQLRKHINDMPASLQTALKRDVFYALESIVQKEHPLRDVLPRPMQYLTDPSRRHLREVLEYLESTGIPYAIDDMLIGHKDCYTQTLFEIRVNEHDGEADDMTVARGGRFDEVTRRFFRSIVPGAGITIEGGTPRRAPPAKLPSKRPKVCLIHIGFGAKRQSLPLVEMLRKARIPLHHSLGSDQLSDQLALAETLRAPYALIMGQREALDGTVILRTMATQSQETIAITTLPEYLRKMSA